MTSLLLASMLLSKPPIHLLFLGNSHTQVNNLPGMVRSLAESDDQQREVEVQSRSADFLETFASQTATKTLIQSRRWDGICLQGLKLSSSHKYEYDHTGAIEIALLAAKNSEKCRLFAEWPRRDWDEAEWQVSQYGPTSKKTGVPIATVGLAWGPVLKEFPTLNLWQSDGNHASLTGTYLAACGMYYSIFGDKSTPTWRPAGVSESVAKRLLQHARNAVAKG